MCSTEEVKSCRPKQQRLRQLGPYIFYSNTLARGTRLPAVCQVWVKTKTSGLVTILYRPCFVNVFQTPCFPVQMSKRKTNPVTLSGVTFSDRTSCGATGDRQVITRRSKLFQLNLEQEQNRTSSSLESDLTNKTTAREEHKDALLVFVSHYKLVSYVCVFMAGKAQTNPESVLWSIKLWLILPVMWKQRVYKMPGHNRGMICF